MQKKKKKCTCEWCFKVHEYEKGKREQEPFYYKKKGDYRRFVFCSAICRARWMKVDRLIELNRQARLRTAAE